MSEDTRDFPLARHLGMSTRVTARGGAEATLRVTDALLNPHGSVHGAVLFAMVDTAMGAATMSVLTGDSRCASADLQLRFCRPVFAGPLVARAQVLRAGKRLVHLEAKVTDEEGHLVSFGTGAFAVIPGEISTG
ncbi:PaaI family thioesterase [Intrasporangium sp.]|uniref:PaaI family thioesterase n=1 Tax=Intrasporangium sp. TaxID=1925024 RepID=UPI00322158FD